MASELASVMVFLGAVAHVFLVNVTLSGDNAVVVAAAARRLPAPLRRRAIRWGLLLGVALQIVLTCVATLLIRVPGLMIVGGIALFYVTFKLLTDEEPAADVGDAPGHHSSGSLGTGIRLICVAQVVMSVDNVLAVAGASGGHQIHMLLGLISSVVFLVFLSNAIAMLMDRYPWLLYVGASVLAYTATEMILTSHETATVWRQGEQLMDQTLSLAGLAPPVLKLPHGWLMWPIQVLTIGVCLGYGYLRRRKSTRRTAADQVAVCQLQAAKSGLVRRSPRPTAAFDFELPIAAAEESL